MVLPIFQAPPAPESKWDVPAITAGTPQERNFARFGSRVRFPYRTSLKVDNHRGSSSLTLFVNGMTRRIGAGSVVTVTAQEVGLIGMYQLDADENVAADVVDVFENGGLTRAD